MSGIEKMVSLIVGAVVLLLVAGYMIINLWPTVTTITSNITSMTGTDQGTDMFQALWPVLIIIVAIVIIISLVFWAIRQLCD